MERSGTKHLVGWAYDYLLSCPGVLVLGYPSIHGLEGIVTLTVLYPRLNILVRGDEKRVLGSVPDYLNGRRVKAICMDIIDGHEPTYDFFMDVVRRAMYLGGYNVFVNNKGSAVVVQSEVVDTSRLAFYARLSDVGILGFKTTSLDEWVLLGTGLREGDYGLVEEACRTIGLVDGSGCRIRVGNLEVLITSRNEDLGKEYFRLLVDNNGLRNVVRVD